VTLPGATLPFYGEKRGPGCTGRWWLVGAWAWTCSDDAALTPDDALAPPSPLEINGLSLRYFFVGSAGASAYTSIENAREGTEDRQLEGGWAVGAVEERGTAPDDRWVRTQKGLWIARRDLVAARASAFHGEAIDGGTVDVAWIVADRAQVWSAASTRPKPVGARARFDRVTVRAAGDDAAPGPHPAMLQIGDDAWVLARDVARPSTSPVPSEVKGPSERWIDVDTATQTLVAYEGSRPVYATLVSTGRGPAGTDTATPTGVHRIWVKLLTSDMDNAEREDVAEHYSMQDVPFVQFFDRAVALHGTYWHGDFGRPHSHGCVNLSPIDARWLFGFTEPRLPAGWSAVLPEPADAATIVRVR
jgi:lipoprotein-anchoring transpeptidase ErfK/SrfK